MWELCSSAECTEIMMIQTQPGCKHLSPHSCLSGDPEVKTKLFVKAEYNTAQCLLVLLLIKSKMGEQTEDTHNIKIVIL